MCLRLAQEPGAGQGDDVDDADDAGCEGVKVG
jgi:hypothetical protein